MSSPEQILSKAESASLDMTCQSYLATTSSALERMSTTSVAQTLSCSKSVQIDTKKNTALVAPAQEDIAY